MGFTYSLESSFFSEKLTICWIGLCLDDMFEPEVTAVHRLEVISGTGRRRQFASDFNRLLQLRLKQSGQIRVAQEVR